MPETTKQLEREQFAFELTSKPKELDEGMFRGIASVFGNRIEAWIPTVIHKGAFQKTLRQRGHKVKILWQHDSHSPIGLPVELKETDQGLEVIGKISDTAIGRDVLTLMRDGVVDALSIGFDPLKWEMEEKGKGANREMTRHVKEVKLYEISPVSFAADSKAKISEVNESEIPPVDDDDNGGDEAMFPAVDDAGELTEKQEDDNIALLETHLDAFEGRILSDKNKEKVRKAITALQALLADADAPKSPKSTEKKEEDDDDKKEKKSKKETRAIDRDESPPDNAALYAERMSKLREAKSLLAKSLK